MVEFEHAHWMLYKRRDSQCSQPVSSVVEQLIETRAATGSKVSSTTSPASGNQEIQTGGNKEK